MPDVALRVEHIYKKFRKEQVFNSLRDLIPALTGRMFKEQGLSGKDRREFWALQDISFEVKHGEALGIIGRNGAGKSTILKILSRIMKPTSGRMLVNGRLSALIEVSAGFHQDLTGRENIYLNGTILGMKKREIDAKLEQIVDFSGIEEFIDTPVKRYSSGMYARLGFSVAAHVDPDVLIVDEVLSVGDYVFQQKCLRRMKEVISGGATVLFVSHNLHSVAEFCHRALLLEHGEMKAIGPAREIISAYMHRADEDESASAKDQAVKIRKVTVRNAEGECSAFRSGDEAWIDVELIAYRRCSKLSVTLYITDQDFENVFDTSTERLGYGSFALDAGEAYNCTFRVRMNFAKGVYHPSVLVYRYDTQTEYDHWAPASTMYVSSDEGVGGVVNCFPEVVRREVSSPSSEQTVANITGQR